MKTGKTIDNLMVLSNSQNLPNNGNLLSEKAVFVGNQNSIAEVQVYAATDINIPDAGEFSISVHVCEDQEKTNVSSPFNPVLSGWTDSLAMKIIQHEAGAGDVVFKQGEKIASFTVPEDFAPDKPYLCLKYQSSADMSSAKVDAFVHVSV